MKILLAVDGSPHTKRTLAHLAAHDEWWGSMHQYTVVHVTPSMGARVAAFMDRAALKAFYAGEAEKIFKPIRAFLTRHGIEATYTARIGAPADEISDLANKGKFDLVMIGSHGHNALAGLVLGSVTTRVLASTKVPVLIVR